MRVNGLVIDEKAIGEGLYELIVAKGDEALVGFGMIPNYVPETLRPMIREKILALKAKELGCPDAAALERAIANIGDVIGLDEPKLKTMIAEIEKACMSAIYAAASKAGKMVV